MIGGSCLYNLRNCLVRQDTVPALPGCITQGDTVEECIERAKEAITGYIESLVADGMPIPEETERPQMITIDVATVP